MKVKTRELIIKDDDINNIRQDVLNFLSSSSYKQVLSIKHIGQNIQQIVYEKKKKKREENKEKVRKP